MTEAAVTTWEDETFLNEKRRTKWVAAALAISLLVNVGLVGAVLMLFPLVRTETVVVTVDKFTGNANVRSTIGTVTVSDEEIIAQALVHQYVRDRETYFEPDQKARVNRVYRFSRGEAQKALLELYTEEDNPLNPMERFGEEYTIDVDIRSIVMADNVGTVRFEKTLRGKGEERSQLFVATVVFEFDRGTERENKDRWENPTGFFVTRYRIDEEAA